MCLSTKWTGRSSLCLSILTVAIVLISGQISSSKDFNILLLHQTSAEKLEQRPVGRVLIDGGCVEGIEEGLRGVIQSTGSTGDTVTVARLTVTNVMAHEAMCRFETVVDRYMITKRHRVSLDPPELDAAGMFAKAMERYDAGDYESACYYYSQVLKAAPDNELARMRVESCKKNMEAIKNQPLTDEEKLAETEHIPMYLEIAQSYRKLEKYARAREYIDRVLAIDEDHSQALAIQRLIPTDAIFAHARKPLPGIDEFVPIDEPAEMTKSVSPVYPKIARDANLEGTVWIKALVDVDGSVVDAVVYKSCGLNILDQEALKAAKRNEFKPAMKDGRPVATWVAYKVEFER